MGFTVTRPVGTKDAAFEAYARLLRQQGKDLGNLPRIPDPANPGRAGSTSGTRRQKRSSSPTSSRSRRGKTAGTSSRPRRRRPTVRLGRSSSSWRGAGRPRLRAASRQPRHDPGSLSRLTPGVTNAFVNPQTWNDYFKTQVNLNDLVKEVAPSLTGLTLEQLTELGYAVIDADDDRTWVYVAPAGAAQVCSVARRPRVPAAAEAAAACARRCGSR